MPNCNICSQPVMIGVVHHVVLPDAKYTDTDGETALRRAMYICGVQNNPVTRYTADAIAEKLTREEAEAALKGENHEADPV